MTNSSGKINSIRISPGFNDRTTPQKLDSCLRNGLQVRGQEPLDDHHIPPYPIKLAMFFIDAGLAESEGPDQRSAGDVFGEDARKQLPEAGSLGGVDQRGHSQAACAPAPRIAGDV